MGCKGGMAGGEGVEGGEKLFVCLNHNLELTHDWEKNLQSLASLARLPPKFSRSFGVLCEGSSAIVLCKPFRRTVLQNLNGSAEFWGKGGWSPDPSSKDRLFFTP